MGALNVSPESFHPGSIHVDTGALVGAALGMLEAGAALIDVGARSTAPYRSADVTEDEEAARLGRAVAALAREVSAPISADTCRPLPARVALEAGATVLNDVSGLRDPAVARLAAARGASVIVMASPGAPAAGGRGRRQPGARRPGSPMERVLRLLAAALARARAAGIADGRIVVDPGIGFFRHERVAWPDWDVRVLAGLGGLARLGRPVCVGVSRKSFVGRLAGREDPADRLAGSLAATTVAVLNGAAVIRTHDVAATLDAVRIAERLRAARPGGAPR